MQAHTTYAYNKRILNEVTSREYATFSCVWHVYGRGHCTIPHVRTLFIMNSLDKLTCRITLWGFQEECTSSSSALGPKSAHLNLLRDAVRFTPTVAYTPTHSLTLTHSHTHTLR
jgi:hypothetical protein